MTINKRITESYRTAKITYIPSGNHFDVLVNDDPTPKISADSFAFARLAAFARVKREASAP